MSSDQSFLIKFNEFLDQIAAGSNELTYVLVVIVGSYILWSLFTYQEADIHPLLLERQSNPSPTRQPGETAVHRSTEIPYGYPLRSGLNVKDADSPKWSAGRDGDLRDVWKKALEPHKGGRGDYLSLIKVTGIDAFPHRPQNVMKQINVFGQFLKESKAQRVALYLPNSLELVVAIFATQFYGVTPILIPHVQPNDVLFDMLRDSKAQTLLAPAGVVPLEIVKRKCPSVKQIIWVVEKTSRQMDWKSSSSHKVSLWHEIVDQASEDASDSPPTDATTELGDLVFVEPRSGSKSFDVVEYSQKNLVAAIGAQTNPLPLGHRLDDMDRILPLDSLCIPYIFIMTLAGLYAQATIMLSSAASRTASFRIQSLKRRPTIVIGSAATISKLRDIGLDTSPANQTPIGDLWEKYYMSSMHTGGALRNANHLWNKGVPRLFFVSARAPDDEDIPMTVTDLSKIRLATKARTIYALTTPGVAGPIAQTHMYDYRLRGAKSQQSHFGAPLSCLDLMLVEAEGKESDLTYESGKEPVGEIVVGGPAVVGGKKSLGIVGSIKRDGTLALVK
ncbi:hypothetical protein MMC25_006882 [Agyrium rufum]|nr:hypothetical protein [Agyrium rufum]